MVDVFMEKNKQAKKKKKKKKKKACSYFRSFVSLVLHKKSTRKIYDFYQMFRNTISKKKPCY